MFVHNNKNTNPLEKLFPHLQSNLVPLQFYHTYLPPSYLVSSRREVIKTAAITHFSQTAFFSGISSPASCKSSMAFKHHCAVPLVETFLISYKGFTTCGPLSNCTSNLAPRLKGDCAFGKNASQARFANFASLVTE